MSSVGEGSILFRESFSLGRMDPEPLVGKRFAVCPAILSSVGPATGRPGNGLERGLDEDDEG